MNTAKSQEPAVYLVTPAADDDDTIIAHAVAILARRLKTGELFDRPSDVKIFCQLKLATRAHEVFGVLFLDVQNRLIEFREMFPRVVQPPPAQQPRGDPRDLSKSGRKVIHLVFR